MSVENVFVMLMEPYSEFSSCFVKGLICGSITVNMKLVFLPHQHMNTLSHTHTQTHTHRDAHVSLSLSGSFGSLVCFASFIVSPASLSLQLTPLQNSLSLKLLFQSVLKNGDIVFDFWHISLSKVFTSIFFLWKATIFFPHCACFIYIFLLHSFLFCSSSLFTSIRHSLIFLSWVPNNCVIRLRFLSLRK